MEESGPRLLRVDQEHAVVDVSHRVQVGPAGLNSQDCAHVSAIPIVAWTTIYFFDRARNAATRSLNSGVVNEVNSSASAYSSTPCAARLRCMLSATLDDRSACGGSAVIRSPSSTYSLAFIMPISRGSMAAPPSPAVSPTATCGSAK